MRYKINSIVKMEKAFALIIAVVLFTKVFAYDFSMMSPSGHVICYNYTSDSTVEVTYYSNIVPGSRAFTHWYGPRPNRDSLIDGYDTYINGGTGGYNYYYGLYGEHLSNAYLGYSRENGPPITSTVFRYYYVNDSSHYLSGEITIPSIISIADRQYIVKSIGDFAFFNCSEITSVVMPNDLTSIGNYAFSNCVNIISISTNAIVIGRNAFANCDRLVHITLGDSVQTV